MLRTLININNFIKALKKIFNYRKFRMKKQLLKLGKKCDVAILNHDKEKISSAIE